MKGPETMENERQTIEFVLKLAADETMDGTEAIAAMTTQIRKLAGSANFPEIADIIDPGRYGKETKILDDAARLRLSTALTNALG